MATQHFGFPYPSKVGFWQDTSPVSGTEQVVEFGAKSFWVRIVTTDALLVKFVDQQGTVVSEELTALADSTEGYTLSLAASTTHNFDVACYGLILEPTGTSLIQVFWGH